LNGRRYFIWIFFQHFLQIDYHRHKYYLFPKPEAVLELSDSKLKKLQFSRQKIEYIRGIADLIAAGSLNKVQLQNLTATEVKQRLLQIKGIGNWTASYVMMRCLNFNDAFPIDDVGLHNALKEIMKLKEKPSIEIIKKLAHGWGGWKGYATYYLWRSLLD